MAATQGLGPASIMYLIDSYKDPYAGTEGQLLTLVNNLDRTQFTPHLAVFRSTPYIEEHEFSCPVEVLNIRRMASFRTLYRLHAFARSLRRRGIRLVHIYFNDASLIGPPIFKLFGMRVVISRRDLGFWYTPLNRLLFRITRHFVDRVIANSRAVSNVVQKAEHYGPNQIEVIYNGYLAGGKESAGGDEPLPPQPAGPIIGITANLRPVKRIDDLIRAVSEIRQEYPGAELWIAGEGPQRQALQELTRQLGVADSVRFLGQIRNVHRLVERFTVAVLCSESEGLSNSLLEYMACARPIVASNVGGNPEVIKHQENGLLVEPGNIVDLKEKILFLLANPTLASQLGSKARSDGLGRFTLSWMVNRHMQLYRQLLKP